MDNQILTLKFSEGDYTVPLPVEQLNKDSNEIVKFGESNTFPQEVLVLTEKTSLVSSIIDKITKYVYGEGVNDEYENIIVDDKGTTFAELVYGIINDYVTMGAFAIQVRRNGYKEIKKLDRLRIERIRTNEDNDKFWYHKSWQKYSKANLVYDAFTGAKDQSDSIFYFKNPSGRHVYGWAPYWSALTDISTLEALGEYSINTVNNCFVPSAVISLCEGKPASKDELKKVESDLNEKFCGVKNSAKLVVIFSDSKESAPEINSFQPTDLNAHFLSLKQMVEANTYAAFNIDPILVGVRTSDGVFAQSAYQEAFDLFNKTEILPIQKQIVKAFKKLGYDLKFKPFVIKWSNGGTSENKIVE